MNRMISGAPLATNVPPVRTINESLGISKRRIGRAGC